jgi:hypothetical protein
LDFPLILSGVNRTHFLWLPFTSRILNQQPSCVAYISDVQMLLLYVGKAGHCSRNSGANHPRVTIRFKSVRKKILIELYGCEEYRLGWRSALCLKITYQLLAKIHQLLEKVSIRVSHGEGWLVRSSEKVWIRQKSGLAKFSKKGNVFYEKILSALIFFGFILVRFIKPAYKI